MAELRDDPVPLLHAAARRDQVVVVEDLVRTHPGQLVDGLHGGQDGPRGLAEQVPGLPDGPQAEAELVSAGGRSVHVLAAERCCHDSLD